MDTIEIIGRRVYAKSTVASWDKPEATDLYWLIDIHPDTDGINGTGELRPEVHYRNGGMSILLKRSIRWETITVRLLSADGTARGGETQAAIVYSYAIPQPKVRKGIETRWYHGNWQKFTKTRGWEDLPLPVMVPRDRNGCCVECKGLGAVGPRGDETEARKCPRCNGLGMVPELRHLPPTTLPKEE